jgi:hypothetical protein
MERGTRIFILVVVVLAFIGFIAMLVTGAIGAGSAGGSSTAQYKVSCSGNIVVPAFGAASLSGNQCATDRCNVLGFSLVPGFLKDDGSIRMVVDGQIVAGEDWESTFSTDQEYTLTSSCMPNPTTAKVQLLDDDGNVIDTEEVKFK